MMFKELSGNALKVIAIVAMTIDHLVWVGIETYEQAETPTQIFLHCIGRLTAPMMIFFVAEGYHTPVTSATICAVCSFDVNAIYPEFLFHPVVEI